MRAMRPRQTCSSSVSMHATGECTLSRQNRPDTAVSDGGQASPALTHLRR